MKKTITISFLLLLFFSQVGYYFFYMFQQYEIKEAVKRQLLSKLPASSLEIIDGDVHKSDIEWEEQDKEFYLHGQMYDVAFIKVVNGKKLIYCLNDNKEEDLLKRLAHAVQSGSEQGGSDKSGHHIKFQASDFLIQEYQLHTLTINKPVSIKFIDQAAALITNITEIPTPPPDLI